MNRFGDRSLGELMGVHPHLVVVTTTCLHICERSGIDFMVFDGLRTEEEQRAFMKSGASWTMNSMHLKQPDGYGHAVDLVPLIAGKLRFDAVNTLKKIGAAMREAAGLHGVKIVWGASIENGGDWKRRNDMYHFELDRRHYK